MYSYFNELPLPPSLNRGKGRYLQVCVIREEIVCPIVGWSKILVCLKQISFYGACALGKRHFA
ncbi:MAG: hypothetical protein ACJAW0_000911 [Zhongshania sp.]|jgi:hypothetical protein